MHVNKPDRLTDLGPIDVSALKPLVARLPAQLWVIEDERKENKYGVFHDTQHIVFRFISGNLDRREYYSNPIWDVWKPMLLPVFAQATAGYGFRKPAFPKAMLAKLSAGAVIDRHTDGVGSNLETHKIHVPLETNDGVTMYISDQPFKMAVGHAYEVNNLAPHSVENLGERDRIHLIFEAYDGAEDEASEPTASPAA